MPRMDTAFEAAAREWFESEMAASPFMATFLGIHNHDDQLGDFSPAGFRRRGEQAREWLKRLEAFHPADLSPDNQVDLKLLRASLVTLLEDLEDLGLATTYPSWYAEVGVSAIHAMLTRDYAPLATRMTGILARLRQIPEVLAHGQSAVGRPPKIFTEIAIETARGGVAFLSALIPPAAEQVPELKAEVLAANDRAIAAMTEYARFLAAEVLPRSDGEFAVGTRIFERRLRENHFLNYTAESLSQTGHGLVQSTLREMEKVAREIDPTRTWQEIVDEAKREHPTVDGLMDAYRKAMRETRDFVIRHDLLDLPPNEVLEVIETPAFIRALIPYAAYDAPAAFEERQVGTFYVTPVDPAAPANVQQQVLEGHNSLSIPLTALHEGYPGHHTQLTWANRNPSLVRKAAGHSTLFAEGWAFYCEELMESLGFVSDPRGKLLRLKDQLWRACRIVIDVGIHCYGMTLEEAANMLVDVAKLEPVNAKAEVARFSMSPTQPMSYLIGKLELLKLADEYRARKGRDFRLKTFHGDLLAHGTIPPALVRELL
ncbi:MAG TPA: DUF885 domain-containing protein [Symbiobacteriaceae bacterium]|nr:DUF885 domain-containing protein [Symbiobacteriaceae bacterium]